MGSDWTYFGIGTGCDREKYFVGDCSDFTSYMDGFISFGDSKTKEEHKIEI